MGDPVDDGIVALHVELDGAATGTLTDQSTGTLYTWHDTFHNVFNSPSVPVLEAASLLRPPLYRRPEERTTNAPPDEEVVAGQLSPTWAWVELNYRPHAYQGRACVVHVRRNARFGTEGVVCTFILGGLDGRPCT